MAELIALDSELAGAGPVVTGEGRLGLQGLPGKVVGEVVRRADRMRLPSLTLASALRPRPQ